MSNVEVQGSKEIERPKFQIPDLDTEYFDIWHSFDICLREAASAKAGILTFEVQV